jgi:hypothetical protein
MKGLVILCLKIRFKTLNLLPVTLDMDKVNYMNKVPLTLDAVLGIDFPVQCYTFKENKALVNQLPLEFDGLFNWLMLAKNMI